MSRGDAVVAPPRARRSLGRRRSTTSGARLTDEQRQRTLLTLSSIVIRQLGAPRDEQEVRDEDS